ncbi:MAG TPA: hypothetical protein PLE60_13250, partial [Candidatus Latescibacteria bacterium]|nr:hypothetical protein [Candidatus Latescibacterota bacterium]
MLRAVLRSALGLSICVLFAAAPGSHAEVPVSGEITTTTWTKANSPYRVVGDIHVPSGDTLT